MYIDSDKFDTLSGLATLTIILFVAVIMITGCMSLIIRKPGTIGVICII